MEPEKTKNTRLTSLDGLRGFAIILVFLTHINAEPILAILPPFLRVIGETIFSSGVTGVSILFILCGFLMAYLYPETETIPFLQRRYTRIFPLFLSMGSAMAAIRLSAELSPLIRLLVIIGFALISHALWMMIRNFGSARISRAVFYCFLGLQIIVGSWYAFYIMRKPAAFFNSALPKYLHDITVWLVNITLTLPLGNYIGMLDGVYWSLASEVLFYILFPIICIPIMKSLSKTSRIMQSLFLLSLIPFIVGIHRLSGSIFALNMLQFPLFYYFITGITLAVLYKKYQKSIISIFENSWLRIVSRLSMILFVIILFLVRNNLHTVHPDWNPLLRILWTIPLTFFVLMTIINTSQISRIFSSKALVYLGTISYSLYLCHTITIEILKDLYRPTGVIDTLIFIGVAFIFACLLAAFLQYFLERPYFTAKKESKSDNKKFIYHPRKVALSIIVIYIVGILIAYQSSFNFFSVESRMDKSIITSPKISNSNPIKMSQYPKVTMEFTAGENNLGILAFYLKYFQTQTRPKREDNWQKLQIRIKEKNAKEWYAVSDYSPVQIGDSEMLPFGFPQITDSQGKIYVVELELLNPKSNNSIEIKTSPVVISRISQADKKLLIRNPALLITHVSKRLQNVFSDSHAKEALLLATPVFFLMAAFLLRNEYSAN